MVDDHIHNLTSGIDALAGTDPNYLSDPDSVDALFRQLDRLEAVACRAAAALEREKNYEVDGAYSAVAWLCTRRRLPRPNAARRLGRGRVLADMAEVEEAWVAGEVSEAHVGVLGRAREAAPERFAAD